MNRGFVFNLPRPALVIGAFLLALLAGGVGYGGYRYYQQSRQLVPKSEGPSLNQLSEPREDSIPITKPTDDPDWNLYVNEEYGFSVEYPADWEVEEEALSDENRSEELLRDNIKFVKLGYGFISIWTWQTSKLDLIVWAKENEPVLVWGNKVPDKVNAIVSGHSALVMYSPTNQVPAQVTTVLKRGDYVFRIAHFTPKNETPLLWDIYEHFLRTFEFEGTGNAPDELPNFPLGF